MSLGWLDLASAITPIASVGAIAIVGAAPGSRRRRNADLELAHEPKQVGPLEPQCPGRPRSVASQLGQCCLDQPPLEVANGAVVAHRPRRNGWRGSRRPRTHGEHPGQVMCHKTADTKSTGYDASDLAAAVEAVQAAHEDAAVAGHARRTQTMRIGKVEKRRPDLSVRGRSGQATGGPSAPGDAGRRLRTPRPDVPRASWGTPSAR